MKSKGFLVNAFFEELTGPKRESLDTKPRKGRLLIFSRGGFISCEAIKFGLGYPKAGQCIVSA